MRIAILTSSYPAAPGDPSGHFVRSEALALAERGHQVAVFAPGPRSGREPGNPRLHWIGSGSSFGWPGVMARLADKPWRLFGIARFMTRAARQLRDQGPFERVVAHWLVPCAWPLAAELVTPAGLEAVAHGSDVQLLERLPRAITRRVTRALLASGASLRCVSEELAERLLALEPALGPAVRVEPCALDLSGAIERSAARAQLHHETRPLCVVVARLVEGKRVAVALSAARLLPAVRSVVIGDGPLRAELE
ncbi:MAG TPA: glycosyltransferase, partial [Polyangiaceae bacterium]|nr:glycosyltransferase [Polyangiaceae bacterium]